MNTLFSELRRRHVFRVAAAYGVVVWLMIQVAATTLPAFGAPAWVLRVVIALAALGFPVALVLAWMFELTSHGVRRAEATTPESEGAPGRRRPPFDSRSAGWVGLGMLVGLVTVGAYGWFRVPDPGSPAGAAPFHSVAVLPFASVGGDEGSEYFSEGISEEILNALGQVQGLRVAARTSAFTFRGTHAPLDSIARALNVAYLLEGSVRTADGRVRITARLVNAATGHPLWSQSYAREADGILALQEEIAVAIANALEVKLAGDGARDLVRSRTIDPEAYELYLQGRHLAGRRTPGDLREAVQRFHTALDRDPAFAAAYSGLADSYALLEEYGGMPREEAYPMSIAAATRALELDELQPEAHASLGHIYYHQRNWTAAERAFRRAITLNPSYATAHHWYGNLLLATSRLPEAVEALHRAYALDPLSPKIRELRGLMMHQARQFEAAAAWYEELLRAEPESGRWGYSLSWTYTAAGRHDDAIATMQRVIDGIPADQSDAWAQARLAAAYAAAGRPEDAKPILERLERTPDQANPSVMGAAYGFLGDFDRAFHWLDLAVARDHWMVGQYPFEAALDPLRTDPRFAAVLKRAEDRAAGAGL